jgi:uncharacterized protein YodC (DUF2158 family)
VAPKMTVSGYTDLGVLCRWFLAPATVQDPRSDSFLEEMLEPVAETPIAGATRPSHEPGGPWA